MTPTAPYDAILVLSFGGPESHPEVMPFLENVVRGRGVPRERLLAVAEHYYALGGRSPINEQCRAFVAALKTELAQHDIALPIYWGNRNWKPTLQDTLVQMRDDGIARALCFVTSAFSSYSGCRQYLQDIERARNAVGEGAPAIDKLRVFYNHPDFLGAVTDAVHEQLQQVSTSSPHLVFTAHSIPLAMANGCDYEAQLKEACELVANSASISDYALVYQSRSGPPQVPWLEPDILDHLRTLSARNVEEVLLCPIGFLSDHMEVVWDLDHEAKALCEELGLSYRRAATPLTTPRFISMVRELLEERLNLIQTRRTLGTSPARPDTCATNCCLYTPRRPGAAPSP